MDKQWIDSAACRGWPVGWFFPDEEDEANFIIDFFCMGCPVKEKCLEFAEETRSEGIWGGYLITYEETLKNESQ